MDQPMLWLPAAESISLNAYYLGREGWDVVVGVRREGQRWQDVVSDRYQCVATHELLQLVEDSLSSALRQRT